MNLKSGPSCPKPYLGIQKLWMRLGTPYAIRISFPPYTPPWIIIRGL